MMGGLRTTAMGILPHRDVERALELSLSLDIPFLPQLPNASFYEDMYVQTSGNFPGIVLDSEREKILFSLKKFREELERYFEMMEDEDLFKLRPPYSIIYPRFLELDLSGFYAVRGQVTGPVSFGFRVCDEEGKPIIYHDDVREILFDFIRRKVNVMLRELRERNERAFVWIDEPGLGWVFSAFSGYNDAQAREDLREFFSGVEGLKGLHLCAEVNLPWLLDLGLDILSFDAYQLGEMPAEYARAAGEFLQRGGIIVWGIVPTEPALIEREDANSLALRLLGYWRRISEEAGLSLSEIAERSLLAPARCCVRATEPSSSALTPEEAVERAFSVLGELSSSLEAQLAE